MDSGEKFSKVDASQDPEQFIKYLDRMNALDSSSVYKDRILSFMEIKQGDSILEVGCGSGVDIEKLKNFVGENGQVTGIDFSEAMVSSCKHKYSNNKNLKFMKEDVRQLSFQGSLFDGCRTDRVLVHIDNVDAAISEIIRVTKAGGRIVLSEPDWENLIIDSNDIKLTRRIISFINDQAANGNVGRKLYGIAKREGVKKVLVQSHTTIIHSFGILKEILVLDKFLENAISADEFNQESIQRWSKDLELKDAKGEFFSSFTNFIVVIDK